MKKLLTLFSIIHLGLFFFGFHLLQDGHVDYAIFSFIVNAFAIWIDIDAAKTIDEIDLIKKMSDGNNGTRD